VAHDGEDPALLLDAGTGIRKAARLFEDRPFRGTILFGHLHWDHTQGLPFFSPGDSDDAIVNVLIPEQGDTLGVLSRFMSPPHFPISPDGLRGRWSFAGLEPGDHEIEGFSVIAIDIPHKGGRAFGYRISDDTGSFAYLSDHGPSAEAPGPQGQGEFHQAAQDLARGVDVLIHDSQHTATEFPARAFLGHSAIDYAVGLAEVCKVKRLVLFHHDPTRTDDQLDEIVAHYKGHRPPVSAAAEGDVIDLPLHEA
jgi:phosphoribosyl 1,2-cyclic phosphodiesterase